MILAVPSCQYEAAVALNLTPLQRMRRIIIPQAVARMLPPFGNLMIELLKSTSLVYFITLSDLTYEAMILRNNYLTWTPRIFGLLLVVYFIFSGCITLIVRLLERNDRLGGKMLTAEQIARTAVFLASDDAEVTTGQVLHVNGGSYMP